VFPYPTTDGLNRVDFYPSAGRCSGTVVPISSNELINMSAVSYTYTDQNPNEKIVAVGATASVTIPAPPASSPGWTLSCGGQSTSSGGAAILLTGAGTYQLTASLNGTSQSVASSTPAGTNCTVVFGTPANGEISINIMGAPGGL
jgi:hypothetical protein